MPEGQDTTILFINGLFSTILETDLKAVVKLVTMGAIRSTKISGNFGAKLNGSKFGPTGKVSIKLVDLFRWTIDYE